VVRAAGDDWLPPGHGQLYDAGGKLASLGTRILGMGTGRIGWLPPPLDQWTKERDFPSFAEKSFHQIWAERKRGKPEQGE
jgi:hypothetical protein